MKTAVQLIIEHLNSFDIKIDKETEDKFTELSKQEIIDSFNSAWYHIVPSNGFLSKTGEEYFNETFKQ